MNYSTNSSSSKQRVRGIRLEPFSKRDQAVITRELHDGSTHSWEGSRKGVRVRLELQEDLLGKCIAFQVLFNGRWKKEWSDTVAHALETLNRVIRTREWENKSRASQN